jgi:hypothetical protein
MLLAVSGLVAASVHPAVAGATPANVRVTVDNGTQGSYMSADQLGGGTYTDDTLKRCGMDRRPQNEPTIAIDPRNTAIRTSGSNEYCALPINGDAWAGFYRSTDSGTTWTDSLLPGYLHDTSSQGLASPVHQMAVGGALAAGDPVQAWDTQGDLFYMGNNFNRGTPNGKSPTFRDNTGDIWVATYAPSNPEDPTFSTDGSRYLRTVIVGTNTFGRGQSTDKTGIGVDPTTGDVFAAWSVFHGSGCNEIDVARSTNQGLTFSAPLKVSGGLCTNQGPNWAFGPSGQVDLTWQASGGGSKGQGQSANGAGFVSSVDGGQTFSSARIAVFYAPFKSNAFSGNGARQCGDGPFACPTGFTFPRFDLASPTITTSGTAIEMAFQVALPSGQGQIQFTRSTDGGTSWSTPAAVDPQTSGHQFFPWLASSGSTLYAVYYDSRMDGDYAPTRAPCNNAAGGTSACLGVWGLEVSRRRGELDVHRSGHRHVDEPEPGAVRRPAGPVLRGLHPGGRGRVLGRSGLDGPA